jgi:hypothetical protein
MLCLILGECKIYLETAKTFKQIKHGMTEAKMVLHQVTVSDADLCCYLSLEVFLYIRKSKAQLRGQSLLVIRWPT